VRILAMLPPPTAYGYVNSRGEMGPDITPLMFLVN